MTTRKTTSAKAPPRTSKSKASKAKATPAAGADFAGFPKELLRFLRDLGNNNQKAWFDANRAAYDDYYVEPAKAFVEAMEPGLVKISKDFRVDPRVNGSIMRINRDIRFSKDKTPYKTGLFVRFAEGRAKGAPGFGIHIHAGGVGMMGGVFGLDSAQLVNFRNAVLDAKSGPAFERAVAKVRKAGCETNEPHYKRVPRDFDAKHPRADWLRYRSLHASIDAKPLPKALLGKGALHYVLKGFATMRPVQKWLVENL